MDRGRTTLTFPPVRLRDVRGLVFDLDGTLVDSYAAITVGVNAARGAYGLGPLEIGEVRARVGRGIERLMADLVGEDRIGDAVRLFGEAYARVYLDETAETPGARATVLALRDRGFRLAIASNKPVAFCLPLLERLGMLRAFDTVEAPETAGAPKPDPVMIRRCLGAMGLQADAAVYVGDMPLDVETAAAAGTRVVLVAGGSSSKEQLDATGAIVLRSLPALLDLLPTRSKPLDGGPA